jgi:hypothetical protein
MRDVFNVYGDRSENTESNYKYSGGKMHKEIKVLGENTKVLCCPRNTLSQINLSLRIFNRNTKKDSISHHFLNLDEMVKNILKGHGNEADFLGFLQKLVPQRSLTHPFAPFRFWLRIRGDIRRKTAFECLKENSASRGVAMVSRGVAIRIFKKFSAL